MFYLLFALLFLFIFLAPAAFLVTGWYRNNFANAYIKSGLEYDNGLTGFEVLPSLGFDVPELCGGALYLGPNDIYTECADKCKSGDYEYIYIKPNQRVIINKKELSGSYCIKKTFAKCNLNVSMAIVGDDSFKCVSQFPTILGGESGNLIVACDGKIDDLLLKTTYDTVVPTNLTLSDFDEKLDDGRYRFKCHDSKLSLPATIATRLEVNKDICSQVDPRGTFDVARNKCACTNYHGNGCTLCPSGFGIAHKGHGAKYGYTLAYDCVDPTDVSYTKSTVVTRACGEKTLLDGGVCQRAVVYGTNTYTPMALENMFG